MTVAHEDAGAAIASPRDFSARDFRDAMGHFATGVVVITTEIEGVTHAMTANAFMSGSLDPFLVLVSVARTARMHDRILQSQHYGINILGQNQQWVSNHFAGKPTAGREPEFEQIDGIPVLAGVAMRLTADLVHEYPCGDHTLFVGEVRALELKREHNKPLLYYGGRYRHVAAPDWSAEAMVQLLWQENDHRY